MKVLATGTALNRPRVLVVDDDRTLCTLASEALGAAGFAVETAADGEVALKLLETLRPDAILLDILLPGIDGIALCRRLCAAQETRETPIIMMTGLDDLSSIQQAFQAGATDFVIKPPSWFIVAQRLRYVLRASLAARELAAVNARLQREISEREHAALSLRESEERLRLALMAANQGLYDLNLQTGKTVVSPEYARMLGYEPGELSETNATFRARLHDEDRTRVHRAFIEHLSGALDEYRAEFRQKTKTGEWKWIFSLGRVVERDEQGRPLRMIGTHTDITERKRDEAELRKLSLAIEQSANVVVVTDVEGRIEYVNPRFEQVTGYAAAEALGQTPRILKSGEQDAECYRQLWQTIKSGNVWKGVLHNRRKDGTLYWDDTTIAPVFDSGGALVNFMAIKEDVTARRQLEQAERDQRQLAEALRDSAAAMNGTLELEGVLDRILDSIGLIARFDAVFLVMLEGVEARVVRQRGEAGPLAGQPDVREHYRLTDLPLLKSLLETGNSCVIADTLGDPLCEAGYRLVGWTRSCFGIPLEIRGRVVGAIVLVSAQPGFFTAESAPRLRAFASQASVAIENAELYKQVHRLSLTDGLTGLSNRRHFFDVAKVEFERTRRHGRPLSVAMFDIDRFKDLNDRWGHLAGDAVLREVARRVRDSVRAIDVTARYGGEEFVVLMPETDLAEALLVAERACRRVGESPVVEGGVTVATTVSVGVAEINEECASIEEVLKCADQALYAAKAAGRNRVEAWKNPAS